MTPPGACSDYRLKMLSDPIVQDAIAVMSAQAKEGRADLVDLYFGEHPLDNSNGPIFHNWIEKRVKAMHEDGIPKCLAAEFMAEQVAGVDSWLTAVDASDIVGIYIDIFYPYVPPRPGPRRTLQAPDARDNVHPLKTDGLNVVKLYAEGNEAMAPNLTLVHQQPEPDPAQRREQRQNGPLPKMPEFTAATLQTMIFPPLEYLIPGIIPEGLTLIAGRPKLGKSWLLLEAAIALTTKDIVLGLEPATQGDVLALFLEDGKRRVQSRITKLMPTFTGTWPSNLHIHTEWPRQDQGGIDAIEDWIKDHPAAKLIIVDTLERFRPKTNNKQDKYAADYEALSKLQGLASKYNISILVSHHDRKSEAEDLFDTVSGTLGLTGAVDTILLLKRQKNGTTLHVRGRDLEDESEKAVQFDKITCRWIILGNAAEVHSSNERKRILEALRAATEPLGPKEIAIVLQMKESSVKVLLGKMVMDHQIDKQERGKYVVAQSW